MDLSAEQFRALASGEAVPMEINGTSCVLLREDIYGRVKTILDVETAYPLIDETSREGWDAPGMQDYDRYDELRRAVVE
jgi:hypothetical protein